MLDGVDEDVRYRNFNWMMSRFDYTSSTIQYELYANRHGGYFIVKIDKTNGVNTYYRKIKLTDLLTDWANRTGLTYKENYEVF